MVSSSITFLSVWGSTLDKKSGILDSTSGFGGKLDMTASENNLNSFIL